MNKLRVGITGAAGQVGSVIVQTLSANPGIETVAVCRNLLSAGVIHSLAPGCDIRIGSLARPKDAGQLLGDCDTVVNCALAMVSARPRESREQNLAIGRSLLELPKLSVLIHLSSIAVYGGSIDAARYRRRKDAFRFPRPDNDYGRSKLAVERRVARRAGEKNISCYILRLGHVIGAHTDRSRAILMDAANPAFRLPFEGTLPSNTIRVGHLAVMIEALVHGKVPSGVYDAAEPSRTWREVFDWHTRSTGLPDVGGLDDVSSRSLKQAYRSRSVVRDGFGWLASLSPTDLLFRPSMFELVFRVLALTPATYIEAMARWFKRRQTRQKLSALTGFDSPGVAPAYYSDPMPGKQLQDAIRIAPKVQDHESAEMREWHRRYADIQWLPQSIPGSCRPDDPAVELQRRIPA
jgi:nucleoside-diphosphate-sugar epimerase